jgi:hypothetical protein
MDPMFSWISSPSSGIKKPTHKWEMELEICCLRWACFPKLQYHP